MNEQKFVKSLPERDRRRYMFYRNIHHRGGIWVQWADYFTENCTRNRALLAENIVLKELRRER